MILNSVPSMPNHSPLSASCSSGTKRPYISDEPSPAQLRQTQPQPLTQLKSQPQQQKQQQQQQQKQQQQQQQQNPQSNATQDSPSGPAPPPLTTFSTPRSTGPPSGNNNNPPSSNPSSSFRNVSACNRCRLRKNRCDQQLPRCQSCEKARVHCVGYDPITKREIPRSYVYFLEARITYLENLLVENQVDFRQAEAFEGELAAGAEGDAAVTGSRSATSGHSPNNEDNSKSKGNGSLIILSGSIKDGACGRAKDPSKTIGEGFSDINADHKDDNNSERLNDLVSNIGMVSVQGASDPRSQGSSSGISFARVVFAAVKSSVATGTPSDRMIGRSAERLPPSGVDETSSVGNPMRDSLFGLNTRPTVNQAEFPDRELASRLVGLYFEHANPQIPILHRGEFMDMFNHVYSINEEERSSRELYILNIVFAIGAGIIFDTKTKSASNSPEAEPHLADDREQGNGDRNEGNGKRKRQKLSSIQYQPEEYHASAIIHLEEFLSWSPNTDRHDGLGGGLEELQAVLLLAGFALLRPVSPGLWYIVGIAVRLAVDLGLHHEDGTGIDSIGDGEGSNPAHCPKDLNNEDGFHNDDNPPKAKVDPLERGRREWVRDLRRRLWWCVYSFDRLVSTCVGRPFGISDQAITTEFPSPLDDAYITKEGFKTPPPGETQSYKHASYHYFRLRLLQSEIQQVLHHQQIRKARRSGKNSSNSFMHTKLSSPFLEGFDSFRSWRTDMHRQMEEWKDSAPSRTETGVQFSTEFLELNYWQAVIMLYRQCLAVPAPLAREMSPAEDVSTPSLAGTEDCDDEENIYVKVAEAGQKVLRLYRQLHRVRLVNYTFLATHHLFMAGISFLYAIWYSQVVRSRLTLDEVDFTVLAATSVLGDLMDKCPPAEACRDAFERMSKATVQMVLSSTGFGYPVGDSPISRLGASSSQSIQRSASLDSSTVYKSIVEAQQVTSLPSSKPRANTQNQGPTSRPQPTLDMNFTGSFNGNHSSSNNSHPIPHSQSQSNYPVTTSGGPHSAFIKAEHPSSPPYQYQFGDYNSNNIKQMLHSPVTNSPSGYDSPGSGSTVSYGGPHPQFPHSQPPSSQYYYAHTPQTTTPISATPVSASAHSHAFSREQECLPPQELDFMNLAPGQNSGLDGNVQNNHGTGNGTDGVQMLPPTSQQPGTVTFGGLAVPPSVGLGAPAIELGFGMEIDLQQQHDWSDGLGYDLFDGYFFGTSGGHPGFHG